jgi:phenylpropionate dioxygenase-like ring-hydroxylating dioxygenase large terminal subunit
MLSEARSERVTIVEPAPGVDAPPEPESDWPAGDGPRARRAAQRERIPADGLREYWYPAMSLSALILPNGRRRPAQRTLLGRDLVLFRTRAGVGALENACPHRGMPLDAGRSHYDGTLTCAYHGWTFDTDGQCVAVLSEGPDSTVPGRPGYNVRSYPTRVLKGIVFIWMGEGEPAPIEQDVPPEFFKPDARIYHSEQVWDANWRPAMENYLDSHVYYVHRNSLRMLTLPPARLRIALKGATQSPETSVVNARAIAVDSTRFQTLRGVLSDNESVGATAQAPELTREDFQFQFPALGGQTWPKTYWRLKLSQLAKTMSRGQLKATKLEPDEEWTMMHLPATIRIDNSSHIYTRMLTPIDAQRTRVFFLHTRYPRNRWQDLLGRLVFWSVYNPIYNINFTGQDRRIVEKQDYERRERLSPTDSVPLAWRRLILSHSRDLARRDDDNREQSI